MTKNNKTNKANDKNSDKNKYINDKIANLKNKIKDFTEIFTPIYYTATNKMNIYFGYTINQNTYAIYIMKKSEKQLEMGYEYNVKSKETTFKTTNIGENKSKMITMHQKKNDTRQFTIPKFKFGNYGLFTFIAIIVDFEVSEYEKKYIANLSINSDDINYQEINIWTDNLADIEKFKNSKDKVYIFLNFSENKEKKFLFNNKLSIVLKNNDESDEIIYKDSCSTYNYEKFQTFN